MFAAVRAALAMAGAAAGEGRQVRAAAFCLAGLDWASDDTYWRGELAAGLPGLGCYHLMNDGFALLRAGEPAGTGVAVSVGTGGAVVSRGADGTEWSASFWIVDALGGFALGSKAYRAVVKAELGIAPATRLREVLLSRHAFPSVAVMLEQTTSRGAHPIRHAALARDVLDTARAGDAVAREIVATQAELIAQYAQAAVDQVGLRGSGPTVVLGGSVLSSHNPTFRDATLQALGRHLPDARPLLTPRSPVVGAVAEALATGGRLGPDVTDRLTRHAFPPEFLLT